MTDIASITSEGVASHSAFLITFGSDALVIHFVDHIFFENSINVSLVVGHDPFMIFKDFFQGWILKFVLLVLWQFIGKLSFFYLYFYISKDIILSLHESGHLLINVKLFFFLWHVFYGICWLNNDDFSMYW